MKCKVVELINLSFAVSCFRSLDCTLLVLKDIDAELAAKPLFSTSIPANMADTDHGDNFSIYRF